MVRHAGAVLALVALCCAWVSEAQMQSLVYNAVGEACKQVYPSLSCGELVRQAGALLLMRGSQHAELLHLQTVSFATTSRTFGNDECIMVRAAIEFTAKASVAQQASFIDASCAYEQRVIAGQVVNYMHYHVRYQGYSPVSWGNGRGLHSACSAVSQLLIR